MTRRRVAPALGVAAWGATALLGYRLSECARLALGYRYYDIHGSDHLDIRYYGPLVGIAFKF